MGRLTPHKNVDLLIESFKKSGLAERDTNLVICGDGIQRSELESLVSDLDLNKNVVFTGFLHKPVIEQLMKCSDLLCLLSLYEGMPNVVIEAMKASLPILLSPSDSHTSIFNSDLVYFTKNFESHSVACALKEKLMLCDHSHIISNSLKFSENFTVDTMGDKYFQMYEEILWTQDM
ncbi:hypothetical protein A3749_13190 [Oleiphilus sp. HI0078]|nr:hypothetical protein A3749_13190 [Oleiphilus sp. HI0078]